MFANTEIYWQIQQISRILKFWTEIDKKILISNGTSSI